MFIYVFFSLMAFLGAQMVKNLRTVQQIQVRSLGGGRSPGEGMATHSCIRAWNVWTEKPGGLQSMGSERVRHD